MQIHIRIEEKKKTITLKVGPNDTIIQVQVQIASKEPIHPLQQCLKFDDTLLDDIMSLSECGIKNNDVVDLILRTRILFQYIHKVGTIIISKLFDLLNIYIYI